MSTLNVSSKNALIIIGRRLLSDSMNFDIKRVVSVKTSVTSAHKSFILLYSYTITQVINDNEANEYNNMVVVCVRLERILRNGKQSFPLVKLAQTESAGYPAKTQARVHIKDYQLVTFIYLYINKFN
jgi:hypothetical protein